MADETNLNVDTPIGDLSNLADAAQRRDLKLLFFCFCHSCPFLKAQASSIDTCELAPLSV